MRDERREKEKDNERERQVGQYASGKTQTQDREQGSKGRTEPSFMSHSLPTDNLSRNAAEWHSGATQNHSWGYTLLVLALTLPRRQQPCPITVIMLGSGTALEPWLLRGSVSAGTDPAPGAWRLAPFVTTQQKLCEGGLTKGIQLHNRDD